MTSSCYLAMDNNVFQKWHGFSHVTLLELWDPLYFFRTDKALIIVNEGQCISQLPAKVDHLLLRI